MEPVVILESADEGGWFGNAVAGGGDVDGDGFDDVVVGAPGAEGTAGTVSLYRGHAAGLDSVATAVWVGTTPETWLGVSVAMAGDVDGDGADDLVFGGAGAARVVSGPDLERDTILTGDPALGWAVSGAGDVDGDGLDDLLVGGVGVASLFPGDRAGPGAEVPLRDDGDDADFGVTLAGAGDLDGDGYADLAVAAPRADGGRGAVVLFSGSAAYGKPPVAARLSGPDADEVFGIALGGVGDIDGDGFDDLSVGAAGVDGGMGAARVYPGGADGVDDAPWTPWVGTVDCPGAGLKVAGAGDVDGDGFDDLLVGAPGNDGSLGQVLLFVGGPEGVGTTPSDVLEGVTRGGYFGVALALAGDVDGDGRSEVIVGEPGGNDEAGVAWVFGDDGGQGCGCGTPGSPAGWVAGIAAALAGRRRRG